MIISRRADMAALFSIVVMLLVGCTSATSASITSPTSTRPRESPQSPAPTARATMAPTPAAEVREVVSPVSPLPTPSASPTRRPAPTPTPTIAWPTCESFPATISFLRDNNIWLLDTESGTERQLTYEPEGVGYDYAPSPDGEHVAYVNCWHDEQRSVCWVKVIRVRDAHTRILATVQSPVYFLRLVWLDSDQVSYHTLRSGEPGRWESYVVVSVETGERSESLTSTFHYPSPDGRYELTGHWEPRRDLVPEHEPYRLVDHRTGEQRTVMEESAGFAGWSPDSKLMLFRLSLGGEYTSSLVAVDPQTLEQRVLTPLDRQVWFHAWSPDGRELAYFECDPVAPGIECRNLNLWVADRRGENSYPLLDSHDGFVWLEGHQNGVFREPIMIPGQVFWTADGGRLVFRASSETPRESVWSVKRDGSDLCHLADGDNPHLLDRIEAGGSS